MNYNIQSNCHFKKISQTHNPESGEFGFSMIKVFSCSANPCFLEARNIYLLLSRLMQVINACITETLYYVGGWVCCVPVFEHSKIGLKLDT
jgi:hypothetical protein